MYIIFLNLLVIKFICIFHLVLEYISIYKYLWFSTTKTDLQEYKSVILHLYSWVFKSFIGGNVCLHKKSSEIADLLKLRNK